MLRTYNALHPGMRFMTNASHRIHNFNERQKLRHKSAKIVQRKGANNDNVAVTATQKLSLLLDAHNANLKRGGPLEEKILAS
mmetsp:Transcript_26267/g.45195  ORF Transcript_26267/g.45195 Transcript_26267/m.45195 type:complete len:82 (-) Transcript_26267:82-327(-)